jgi:hypothetical protein
MRTAVLRVPSVTTEGRENNVLINPLHPQFSKIPVSEAEPIHWKTAQDTNILARQKKQGQTLSASAPALLGR